MNQRRKSPLRLRFYRLWIQPKRISSGLALFFCLGFPPSLSWSAGTPADVVIARSPETLVARIVLNTEDKGDLFVAVAANGDYLVKLQDLVTLGFISPRGSIVMLDGEANLSLRSMDGVRFSFDPKKLTLDITADPALLRGQTLQLRPDNRIRGVVPHENSAFLNYAFSSSRDTAKTGTGLGIALEAGGRVGDYLLLANGNTIEDAAGRRKFVRLLSNVTYDDRDNLRRTVAGDFFTPSRELSNGVSLGGLSISKLYSLNPYFIQFPSKTINGIVATPSNVDVFLDGQQVSSQKIQPGSFQLQNLLAYGGARNVQVIVRDAFGRTQQFNYSFYFSDQPLQQGLHEYSYNAGAIRQDYGLKSNQYGPLAFSGFHRYGFTDAITLGLRAEGTKGLFNAGPIASIVLNSAGVVNAALATSSAAGKKGAAGLLSYNYQSRLFGIGMSVRHDWGEYASLGNPITVSNRNTEASLYGSLYLQHYGSISLSHSRLSTRSISAAATYSALGQTLGSTALSDRRTTSLSYYAPLVSGRAALQASLSHISDVEARNEFYLGLIYFLDKDYSASANLRGDANERTTVAQFTKIQPVGEGLGYVASVESSGGASATNTLANSRAQYNAPVAIVQAELSQRQSGSQSIQTSRLSLAGGVAYVGGQTALGRPITESFGIVKVGEIAGVAVAVNGQPMGKTDANGTVFVPTLAPYFDNDVTISPENVPIDYTIPSTLKRISPSLRGGAIINFEVTKIQAFTGQLVMQKGGKRTPLELQEISFLSAGKNQLLQTGRGGEFYVENLPAGSYAATATIPGGTCTLTLNIPKSTETFVSLDDVTCVDMR